MCDFPRSVFIPMKSWDDKSRQANVPYAQVTDTRVSSGDNPWDVSTIVYFYGSPETAAMKAHVFLDLRTFHRDLDCELRVDPSKNKSRV